MELSKLAKRMRREAAANPKKAALLGVLIAVSFYFWIPLIRGWTAGDDQKSRAAANDQGPAEAAKPASPSPSAEKGEPRPNWKQLAQWMHNDPRTIPAPLPVGRRDPFELPKSEIARKEKKEPPGAQLPTITPGDAGLTLSGTLIGPRNRAARINGKTYSLGESIEIDDAEKMVRASFKLTEVHSRGVVLQSGEKRFELKIPDPAESGKIEIQYHRSR